jgi:hypothetical protein
VCDGKVDLEEEWESEVAADDDVISEGPRLAPFRLSVTAADVALVRAGGDEG